MNQNRRRWLQGLRALGVGSLIASCTGIPGATSARVVVIGGGFAGASCARELKRLNAQLNVTLVEPKTTYTACPLSNMVIGGYRSIGQQQFRYTGLTAAGINVVHDQAHQVDAGIVRLNSGQTLEYDKLIMAPGIAINWQALPGYTLQSANNLPHAWQAGDQTLLLQKQLKAMADGGLVVLSIPSSPYRCPPGPYERASLIAHYLREHKPRSKVLLLDAKDNFSKQALFTSAWRELFGNQIEWQGASAGATVVGVDAKRRTFHTDFDSITADVGNVIPPQQAGEVAQRNGLTDSSGWCPIHAATFESTLQENIHIIGDAAIANAMPKSAFAANAQAKLCAAQVVRNLQGLPYLESKLINTCYSLVTPSYGISVAGVYRPQANRWRSMAGAGGTSNLDTPPAIRKREALHAVSWFNHLTHSVFG